MLTGNKGEWSEIYVLLRLLADGKLYAADDNLQKLESIYFPIVKIIREEIRGRIVEYKTNNSIKIYINGSECEDIPTRIFDKEADYLLTRLKTETVKRTFSIDETENFMKKILCFKLSAPSQNKTDITIQVIDINTNYSPVLGFSIKSELGAKPTLLNAGKTTNFIYKITHDYADLTGEANMIWRISGEERHTDVKGRIQKIIEEKGEISYVNMENVTFKNNLELLDSCMDKIVAETLLYFYRDGVCNCDELVKMLEQRDPMRFGNTYAYAYKFKKFLTSIALGMKPATLWDGRDEASGGYVIVTRNGDVLAYHIYNRNFFEDYLLKNTKYDTASTSRHGFGEVYTEKDNTLMKLNLQIRFR